MQDRYVGDVGDYGKYGLLRWLAARESGRQPLRLAVLWYLVPDETHNNDGRHVTYLQRSDARVMQCDPSLFSELQRVVSKGRSVKGIENSAVLPAGTPFHSSPLSYDRTERRSERRLKRQTWFRHAAAVASGADLVFLDPDNGLECNSVGAYSKTGIKYAYYEDVTTLSGPTTSLLIYHHLSRQGTAAEQIVNRAQALARHVPVNHRIAALRFRRGSARVFFVVVAPPHRGEVAGRLHQFLRSPWAEHFVEQPLSVLGIRKLL